MNATTIVQPKKIKNLPVESLFTPKLSILIEAIHIANNGLGIPETVKKRIFDPSFTTKPVGKGTGMGMSISYQIITENHGGTLQCISSPGQGAEFIIEIPLQQPL